MDPFLPTRGRRMDFFRFLLDGWAFFLDRPGHL